MALKDLLNAPRCQHIHFSGKPCKAPARRGRSFCLFHQSAHLSTGCVIPIVEDQHSYQLAIIHILRALNEDDLDPRKASVMLYGLQLAGYNLKQFCDERRRIEDPEGEIGRFAYATFISRKLKMPVPTEKEIDQLLDEAKYELPADPADHPPAIMPDYSAGDHSQV